MFQFRRFPTTCYFIHKRLTEYCSAGFPHSEIHGSRTAFVSPWLIVDRYVLRRLPMPRHSPCALISLTFFRIMCPFGFVNFTQLKNCSFSTQQFVRYSLFSRCFHFTLPVFSFQSTFSIRVLCEFVQIRLSFASQSFLFALRIDYLDEVGIFCSQRRALCPRKNQKFQIRQIGGPEWTRTTDLTLIRRAL